MAQKNILKALGLPSGRKAFLAEFDGDTNAMAGLQQAFESIAESNPEAYAAWESATRNASGIEDIVSNLADNLYGPEKAAPVGVRGKTDAPPERIESNMPTVESKAEKKALPDLTPEQQKIVQNLEDQAQARSAAMDAAAKDNPKPAARVTISPAARKHAASLGVDLANVTGTGKNGAVTKADIDKAAGKTDDAPSAESQASAPAPQQPAAPKPARPMPADPDEPIPGAMGLTQGDLDDAAEPVPGSFGLLTRGDAARFMEPIISAGEPAPLPRPAMDMSRMNAANFPPPPDAPPRRATASDMEDMLSAFDPSFGAAPKVDLSGLTNDPSPEVQGPPVPPLNMSAEVQGPPVPPPGGVNPPSGSSWDKPWPLTSKAGEFLEARGLGMLKPSVRPITGAADLTMKYGIPTAIAVYGGKAALNAMRTPQQSGKPSNDDIREMEAYTDAKRREFEEAFGVMNAPERPGRPPVQGR